MNDNEIRRLAHAVNELRPDWPVSSLTTWLTRNMANRPYRDAAVALVWVAVDLKHDGTPATERPARVLEPGPWWTAAAVSGSALAGRPQPPKPERQCRRCGGEVPGCACQLEDLADDHDDTPDLPPLDQVNPRLAQRIAERLTTEEDACGA